MAGYLVLLVLAFNCFQTLANQQLTIAMAEHLHIRHCLRVSAGAESLDNVQAVKKLSKSFIFVKVCEPKDLGKLIRGNNNSLPVKMLVSLSDKSDLSELGVAGPGNKIPASISWLLESSDSAIPLPVDIPVDIDFWVAEPSAATFQVNSVYQLRANLPQILQPYGYFTPGPGAALDAPFMVPSSTRRDFFGMPFILFVPIPNICFLKSVCVHYHMWEDFARALNFTQVNASVEELQTVYRGHFDAEAIHAPFHYVQVKPNLLAPTLTGRVNMYIKDTFGSHGDIWRAFSRPFERTVWICLAGWLLFAAISLALVHSLMGYQLPFVIESAFTPLDAICCQGGPVRSRKIVSRWSLLMPRLLAAIIFPAYAAAIVSFLAVHVPSLPFEDILGFYQDGTYRLGSLKLDSLSINYFKESSLPELKDIGDRLQVPESELLTTYEENMERLCGQKKFAFLSYNNFFDLVRPQCKIIRIPVPIAYAFAGLPLARDSPYKPALKWVLLKMHSSGLIAREQRELNRVLDLEQPARFTPIAIPQVVIPFVIFAVGWGVAFCVLCVEVCSHRRTETQPINRRRLRGVIVRASFNSVSDQSGAYFE